MPPRKTIHGIDLTAPGGLEALFAFRRAQFGDAQMNANAGDGGDGGEGTGDGEGQQEQQAAEQGKDGQQQEQSKSGDLWEDPAKAKAEIERLRAENGKDRTTAKTKAAEEARNELTQSIGKALGLIKDGDSEKPDPAKLTETITTQATENKTLKAELAVFKEATKQGADAAALLDSRSFLAKIADLDPSDTKAINTAITDAVKDNPKLKLVQAASAGGADFTGGSGEGAKKPNTLDDAIAHKMARN